MRSMLARYRSLFTCFVVAALVSPARADMLVASWQADEKGTDNRIAQEAPVYHPLDRGQPVEESRRELPVSVNLWTIVAVSGIVPFTATPGEEESGDVTSTPDPDDPDNPDPPDRPPENPPINHAPEPGSLALAALGGGCLALLRRRRRNAG